MTTKTTTKAKTKKQFWYIAHGPAVIGRRKRTVIFGTGKTASGALRNARSNGAAANPDLSATLAAKAVVDAFHERGANVKFVISPNNGRASLA